MKSRRTLFLVLFLIATFFALLTVNNYKVINYSMTDKEKEVYKVEEMMDKLVIVDKKDKYKVANAIVNYGSFYKIPYENIVAIAYVESRFNPNAVNNNSKVGKDIGICQINSYYHKNRYSNEKHLYDIDNNIRIACEIMNEVRMSGRDNIAYYHTLSKNKAFFDYQKKCSNTICMIRR